MENNVDLISRERQDSLKTVLSRMKELRCQAAMEPNDPYMTMIKTMLDTLIQHFEKFPAVDAVEVVHCKDCQHWKPGDAFGGDSADKMERIGSCPYVRFRRMESGFCDYGKRKGGADNG